MPAPSPESRDAAGGSLVPEGPPGAALKVDPGGGALPPLLNAPAEIAAAETEPIGEGVRRKKLGLGAWIAIVWMAIVILGAILARVLPISDPIKTIDPLAFNQGPSAKHLLGTNGGGHDVLALTVYGSRASLEIGFGSIILGFLVGGFLGLLSGYYKGRIGGVLGSVMDILLAFPQLVLALAIVTFLGQSTRNIVIALAIVSTPLLGRIARASALTWSEREFVLAARAQGATHNRIMWREVLPNVLPAMFSIALLGVAIVIVAEGGLAILGVGVKPPTPSWGNIIQSGVGNLGQAPWVVLGPSGAMFLTVLALNYLGDAVRARFDVRESAL